MNQQGNNTQGPSLEKDMFDIAGFFGFFWESIRLHKLLIFTVWLLVMGAAAWYHYAWPPIYRGEARAASERDLDPSRDTFYASWQVFRKEDPRDEIKMITSGPVLRAVIDKYKLKYDDVYHPFLSHAGYMWEKSWLGREYKAVKARFVPEPNVPEDAKEFGRTMDGLKAGVNIATDGDSNIAVLTVKGPTPQVSDIANSILDSYMAERKQRQYKEAQTAFNVLSDEAARARRELAAVRDQNEAFAKENQLTLGFQKEIQDVAELTVLETSVADHRSKIAAMEASRAKIEAQLASEPAEKILSSVSEANALREAAKMRRLEHQTRLIELRSKYREDSPEVRQALDEITKLDALIASEPEQIERSVVKGVNLLHQQLATGLLTLNSDLESARSTLVEKERTSEQMRTRLLGLPSLQAVSLDLQREYNLAKEKYERLLFRRMEAQVSATSLEAAPSSVRIVDYATPPITKFWPRLKYLYPVAAVMGLLLGISAALIRSLTSGRLLRSDVDQGRLPAPVYATLSLGGRGRALKVVARQSELPTINPPDQSKEEGERSREAGT
jgi:uncharacterized protein involved in exopolysaccharide biosynthesis